MGGIVTTGLSVKCDRCKKPAPVTDEKQTEFYRTFSKREGEQKDEHMFVGVMLNLNGKAVDIDFEYLCPGCVKAVLGYLAKIDKNLEKLLPKKSPKKKDDDEPKGGAEGGKKDEPKAKPETKKKEEKKSSVTIVDETDSSDDPDPADDAGPADDPEPENEEAPGNDFSDSDLFDD